MNGPDVALIAAGILGAAVAIVHGVLMQRYMVRPIQGMVRLRRAIEQRL